MVLSDKYTQLSPSELKPAGWLKKQLRIQADGLSGHLDRIWPDIADSRWIGGGREGWERVPYWLDGFIPLAFYLGDEDLKARAKFYIDAILAGQKSDGWICPCSDEERAGYDMWAAMLICKALTVWADCSGDYDRIVRAVSAALRSLSSHMDKYPLMSWGKSRWGETLISILWLYKREPSDWLIELAHKLKEQGLDWKYVFREGGEIENQRDVWTHETHVVNLGMIPKFYALFDRIDGREEDGTAKAMLEKLFKFNGTPYGHFTGDECLGGISPIRGAELCSLAEAMYTYECLLKSTGDLYWADRLEEVAFNGYPATFSPDMWTHQYDQMPNQVQCTPMPEGHVTFGTNGSYAHIFGLEPNYGCCTANLSQGFPKLAASVFMKSDDGIVSLIPVDSEVNVEIGGAKVRVTLEGGYPFRDNLRYTVETDRPVTFTLGIRVPSSAEGAKINGRLVPTGEIFNITREWSGSSNVHLSLSFAVRVDARPLGLSVVRRGSLLFSLPIKERWEKHEYVANGVKRAYPYCDYYIFPESEWQYALASDKFTLETPDFDAAFTPDMPPMRLKATVVPITWGFEYGCAKKLPDSVTPIGEKREIEMIPYGCTCLRMTELPYIG